MKRIFTILFSLISIVCFGQAHYNPAQQPGFTFVVNKPFGESFPVALDARSEKADTINLLYRPYNGTAEVLTYLNTTQSRTGWFPIIVNVGGSLQSNGTFLGGRIYPYWFLRGTADSNLVRLYTDSVVVGREMDTIYRKNDSTLGFTIAQGPEHTVLLRGTAAGGISSLALTTPSGLFGNPINFSNTGGAWSGTMTLNNQNPNSIFAGPSVGGPGAPSFRSLVVGDLPTGIPNSNLLNSSITVGLGTSGIDINWSAGSVSLGSPINLNIPTANTGVRGVITGPKYTYFSNKIDSVHFSNDSIYDCVAGVCTFRGFIVGTGITQLTGDGIAGPGGGSQVFTLATVNSNIGSFGDASHTTSFSVNGKGLITSASNNSIQIAESQVTNLVSDLAGKLSGGGNLPPLFTTSVSGNTLNFSLNTVSAYSAFGNFTNATATPSFSKIPYQALAVNSPNLLLGWDGSGNPSPISFTTSGTSGAASLSGAVLNIPVYQGQLTNRGSGYRLFDPTTNGIKSLSCTGCTLDSATSGQIGLTVTGGGTIPVGLNDLIGNTTITSYPVDIINANQQVLGTAYSQSDVIALWNDDPVDKAIGTLVAGGTSTTFTLNRFTQTPYNTDLGVTLNPDTLSSLYAHYRSDTLVTTATGVSSWGDISSNHFNLTQATGGSQPPIYSGAFSTGLYPYVRFSGGTSLTYTLGTALTGQKFTIYMMMRSQAFSSGARLFNYFNGSGTYGLLYYTQDNANELATYSGASVTPNWPVAYKQNQWQLLKVTFNGNKNKIEINDEPKYRDDWSWVGLNADSSQKVTISYLTFGGAAFDMSEGLLLLGEPDSVTNLKIKSYFRKKYRAPINNVVLVHGDSHMEGNNASSNAYTTVAEMGNENGFNWYNYGIGGSGIKGIGSGDLTAIYGYDKDKINANTWFTFEYGTNDNNNVTDSSWKATYKRVLQWYIQQGADRNKLVVCSPPYTTNPTYATNMRYARDRIRELASELNIRFADIHTADSLAGLDVFTRPGGDGIHGDDSMHRVAANEMKRAMTIAGYTKNDTITWDKIVRMQSPPGNKAHQYSFQGGMVNVDSLSVKAALTQSDTINYKPAVLDAVGRIHRFNRWPGGGGGGGGSSAGNAGDVQLSGGSGSFITPASDAFFYNTTNSSLSLGAGTSTTAGLHIGQSLTGSSGANGLKITPTWNTTGNPIAFNINVTNTAAGSGAAIAEIQENSVIPLYIPHNGAQVWWGNNGLQINTFNGNIGGISLLGFAPNSNKLSVGSGFAIGVGTGIPPTGGDVTAINATTGLIANTSGQANLTTFYGSFSPTSGNGTFVNNYLRPQISTNVAATGNAYGIVVDPLLTAATDSAKWQALWVKIGTSQFDDTVKVNKTLFFKANTTGFSQFNLASSSGINVTSPNDGDVWYNGTNLNFRHGGTTSDLLAGGGSTPNIATVLNSGTQNANATWNFGGNFTKLSGLSSDTTNIAYVLVKKKDSTWTEMTPSNFLILFGATDTLTAINSVQQTGPQTNDTLQLVGDKSAPGNNMGYGTNTSGTKGWYSGLGNVFSQTANGTALTNSTTATDIAGTGVGSTSIPANTLKVGDVVVTHMTTLVSTAASSPGTLTIGSMLGGSSITFTPIAGLVLITADITIRTTILTIGTSGTFSNEVFITFATGSAISQSILTTSAAINTTIANNFSVQATWGTASSSNSIQSYPAGTTIKIN